MNNPGNLKLTTRGDREIVITRVFDAPRKLVFDAFTKPELVKAMATRTGRLVNAGLRDRFESGRQVPLRVAP